MSTEPKKPPVDNAPEEDALSDTISNLRLDRLEAGELEEAEAQALYEQLKGEDAQALESRAQAKSQFQKVMAKEDFVKAMGKQLEGSAQNDSEDSPAASQSPVSVLKEWLRSPKLAFVAMFMLGAGLAALVPPLLQDTSLPNKDAQLSPGSQPQPDSNRLKGSPILGDPILEVYKRQDQTVIAMESGDRAVEGDTVQFAVRPAGYSHVLILNLDDQGSVTPYYPDTLSSSIELDDQPLILLPDAIEFDHFVGQEIIIALFSTRPLTVPQVGQRLRSWMQQVGNPRPLPLADFSLHPFDESGEVVERTFHLKKE